MLRHQLAVAERERPTARVRLTWPDRGWLALLAGTLPIERLDTTTAAVLANLSGFDGSPESMGKLRLE